MHEMWPAAPVYTFFHDAGRYGRLDGWDLRTSYLQQLPIGGGLHRLLLPLYPGAAERLRVPEAFDVLVSSVSAFIKGIGVAERTVHVSYCHSPTRYLWDWADRYLEEEVPLPLQPFVRDLQARLRETDRRAAQRVDRWIANSGAVQARIALYYGRESEVVHPPVDVRRFAPGERGDFWLFLGRLSPYKRADIAVEVFDKIGMRLIVVGDGRERRSLERRARDNVTFSGRVDDDTVRQLLGSARGLIWPAEDDFGIGIVEALASGTPVVALAAGGAPEIVRDGIDGALVATADADAFVEAVLRVERMSLDRAELRRGALRFDRPRFEERLRWIVADAAAQGRAARRASA